MNFNVVPRDKNLVLGVLRDKSQLRQSGDRCVYVAVVAPQVFRKPIDGLRARLLEGIQKLHPLRSQFGKKLRRRREVQLVVGWAKPFSRVDSGGNGPQFVGGFFEVRYADDCVPRTHLWIRSGKCGAA
jgi:hypothetical protein